MSIYKKIFWGIAIALLIGMPILSTQYGITADEWGNKNYGELCLDFFTSFGDKKEAVSYAPKGGEVMYAYGPTLDLVSAAIYKTFNLPPYPTRHALLALMGALMMIGAGLAGRIVGGNWRAGLVALLIMLFSPRIFGDSMNNPKDITFATGYILTVAFLLKFLQELPKPSWKTTIFIVLGIGLGLGSRAPGLALVAYVPMFVCFELMFNKTSRQQAFADGNAKNIFIKTALTAIGGYIVGILFWPFALSSPLTAPLDAMAILTNFPVTIKTIFGGTKIVSTALPASYVPKYMAMSTPVVFLLGTLLSLVVFFIGRKYFKQRLMFLLYFAALFPLIYAISKHSAFYNGWRHTTFIYPPLVALAAVGFEFLFQKFQGNVQKFIWAILAILLAFPAWFMVKNHPYQYVYFNEISGGLKKAYGNYETDYFGASSKEAVEWLKKNVDLKGKRVNVATDFINTVAPYFVEDTNVKVAYRRFYQRSESDWDYGIFFTSRLQPEHFRVKENFPPKGTIHVVEADGVPLAAIVKRITKDDFAGIELLKKGNVQEALPMLEKALAQDPNNEVILVYLAGAYNNLGQFDKAIAVSQKALEILPNFGSALINLGVSYINLQQLDIAIPLLETVLIEDPRNANALQYLAYCYDKKGNKGMADTYRAMAGQ